MHFAKLFSTILDSSVWTLDDHTRLVWITLLAMADQYGEVHAAIPGVARRAAVPLEACEAALAKLGGPDPYSRTPDHDGRRLEVIPGGWSLINHGKYQRMMSAEQTKARKRKWWKENKGKGAAECHELDETRQLDAPTRRPLDAESPQLDADSTHSTHIEIDVELEINNPPMVPPTGGAPKAPKAKRGRKGKPPADFEPGLDHRQIAQQRGLDFSTELAKFRDHEFARAISDHAAAFRNWLRNATPPRTPYAPINNTPQQVYRDL